LFFIFLDSKIPIQIKSKAIARKADTTLGSATKRKLMEVGRKMIMTNSNTNENNTKILKPHINTNLQSKAIDREKNKGSKQVKENHKNLYKNRSNESENKNITLRQKSANILKGVRTNRRFELQMQHRMANKNA
jgi:hypothetical protein